MAQNLSIWSCVAFTLLSTVIMIAAIVRPPWMPKQHQQQTQPHQPGQQHRQQQHADQPDDAAARAHDPFPLGSSSSAEPAAGGTPFVGLALEDEELDGPDAVARERAHERQWRFVALGTLLQGAAVLLLLIGVAVDVWGEVDLATYAPLSPSDPKVQPVHVYLSFGLGGRKVKAPAELQSNDTNMWPSGAYTRICMSRAILGCAVGFQAGVASVLAHALLALTCGMALFLYLLLVRGCVPALGQQGQSRPNLLAVAWRVALLHCISTLVCPVMWAATSDASLRWHLQGRLVDGRSSVVRVGPSWVVMLVAALLAPPLLWNTRRVLQILHAPDWKGGGSRRLLALAHEYHQAPGMPLVPLQQQQHQQQHLPRNQRASDQEEGEHKFSHGEHLLSASDRERVHSSASPTLSGPRLSTRPVATEPGGIAAPNVYIGAPLAVDPELALEDLEEL